jgi:hypothetical protein
VKQVPLSNGVLLNGETHVKQLPFVSQEAHGYGQVDKIQVTVLLIVVWLVYPE